MFTETLGMIALGFVMASLMQNDMRTLRKLSIVGSVLFMIQAIIMGSISLTAANIAFIIIHIVWFSKNPKVS